MTTDDFVGGEGRAWLCMCSQPFLCPCRQTQDERVPLLSGDHEQELRERHARGVGDEARGLAQREFTDQPQAVFRARLQRHHLPDYYVCGVPEVQAQPGGETVRAPQQGKETRGLAWVWPVRYQTEEWAISALEARTPRWQGYRLQARQQE